MKELLSCLFICLVLLPIAVYVIQKYNMDYFKVNGRQPVEIECWLKTRHWYNDFIDAIKNEILEAHRNDEGVVNLTPELMNKIETYTNTIVGGSYDKETISAAFDWKSSLKGTLYWGKREYQFLMWYYGQYIDLHLFKS